LIICGTSEDAPTGDDSADRFVFAAGDSGTPSATVFDPITNFNSGGRDIIDYSAALSVHQDGTATAGNAAVAAR
jgi:hypothetical protein